jgi:hypothetical protein
MRPKCIIENKTISNHPNASNGKFELSFNDFQIEKINIFNLASDAVFQTVFSQEESKIKISNQPAGIYRLEIIGENNKTFKKIVKE